jgi:hypothetical protein
MLCLASFGYDGFRERTAWAAADDGFLVIDLNADGTRGAGDGLIDQRSELVLSEWGLKGRNCVRAGTARILISILLIALTFISFSSAISAQGVRPPIAGEDDARFLEARQLWLEGNDLEALSALAQLAREDITAAQILLSRIARTPHTHEHFTENLTRTERIALFREEVGLSGRDWMERAAETSLLAQAFWQYVDPDVYEGRSLEMLDILSMHGEVRAAIQFAQSLAFETHDTSVIPILYDHLESLGYAAFPALDFAIRSQIRSGAEAIPLPRSDMTQHEALAFVGHLAAPQGHLATTGVLQFMNGQDYSVPSSSLNAWIAELPELAPLRTFCEETCPLAISECEISSTRALTLSAAFPHPMASPSQALISDVQYWASARFDRDLEALLQRGNWGACSE